MYTGNPRFVFPGQILAPELPLKPSTLDFPFVSTAAKLLSLRCLWGIKMEMSSRHPLGFMLVSSVPVRHLHFDVSQASQTDTWTLDICHHPSQNKQIFFPVFPIPMNGTNIPLARDLEMSSVLLLYLLCRIDQCILWSLLFFSSLPVSAPVQPTNTSPSFLLTPFLSPCALLFSQLPKWCLHVRSCH